jgi:SAM-dependent methyltransferase
MLGTPTIGRSALSGSETWGSTALNLADRIATHESRASSTYYLRCFQQYFDGLARSVSELRRVVKPGGKAFLVVQDSHYKEIRVDLAQVVSDMARISGWSEATRLDFATRRTLARVNPMSRRYRQDFLANESVVTVQ